MRRVPSMETFRGRQSMSEKVIGGRDLERLVDDIQQLRRGLHVEQTTSGSKVKTGRPPRLRRADEFELYCYRKSGVSIKTCASMFRVSVPTANRIIAKFREWDERVEPVAREFRDMIEREKDSTLS
jgi:hypothetical protein